MAVEEKFVAGSVEMAAREPLYRRQPDRARVDNLDSSTNAMQSWS